MRSRGRLTKRQATSRPDHLCPELRTKLGRISKLKEKQKWSNEKSKFVNARRLRGIYFIDPEDKEFKETIRNARKKLETPIAPAMPGKTCKKSKNVELPLCFLGLDRNAELKRRLQMLEARGVHDHVGRIPGHQHAEQQSIRRKKAITD